jgi:signal recognition particle subunit SRP54
MGPLREVMAKMPLFGELMDQLPEEALDDGELDRTLAIIGSMTHQERTKPDLLDDGRFRRIAKGCGRSLSDVRELHERFGQARAMMKGLGSMLGNPAQMLKMQQQMARMQQQGGGGIGGLMSAMQAGGAPEPPERAGMSAAERDAKRKRAKLAKKQRKKNR